MYVAIPTKALKRVYRWMNQLVIASKSPPIFSIHADSGGVSMRARIDDGIVDAPLPDALVEKPGTIMVEGRTIRELPASDWDESRTIINHTQGAPFAEFSRKNMKPEETLPEKPRSGVAYPAWSGGVPPIPESFVRQIVTESISKDALKALLAISKWARPFQKDSGREWQSLICLDPGTSQFDDGSVMLGTDGHRAIRWQLAEPVVFRRVYIPVWLAKWLQKHPPTEIHTHKDCLITTKDARVWYTPDTSHGQSFDLIPQLIRTDKSCYRAHAVLNTSEFSLKLDKGEHPVVICADGPELRVEDEPDGSDDAAQSWLPPAKFLGTLPDPVNFNGRYLHTLFELSAEQNAAPLEVHLGGPLDPLAFDMISSETSGRISGAVMPTVPGKS